MPCVGEAIASRIAACVWVKSVVCLAKGKGLDKCYKVDLGGCRCQALLDGVSPRFQNASEKVQALMSCCASLQDGAEDATSSSSTAQTRRNGASTYRTFSCPAVRSAARRCRHTAWAQTPPSLRRTCGSSGMHGACWCYCLRGWWNASASQDCCQCCSEPSTLLSVWCGCCVEYSPAMRTFRPSFPNGHTGRSSPVTTSRRPTWRL